MYIDPTLFEMENIIQYKLENTPYIIFVPFNGNNKWEIFFSGFPHICIAIKKTHFKQCLGIPVVESVLAEMMLCQCWSCSKRLATEGRAANKIKHPTRRSTNRTTLLPRIGLLFCPYNPPGKLYVHKGRGGNIAATFRRLKGLILHINNSLFVERYLILPKYKFS